jgi:hypothetical protein
MQQGLKWGIRCNAAISRGGRQPECTDPDVLNTRNDNRHNRDDKGNWNKLKTDSHDKQQQWDTASDRK